MTTQTAATKAAISTGALVAAVCAFALLCASLLGLYALAPERPDITPLFSAIPGAIAACGVFAVGWMNRRHHASNGEKLDVITHQTNGVLDAKITRAVTAAVSATVPLAVASALQGFTPAGDAASPLPAPAPESPSTQAPAPGNSVPPDGGM